ncbi:relaxase/mobilization nuclease domain-containing protein [Pontibacter mangrovi]|nr:relaxase/mobilization nuclease domain-containing protein [Pontibacter mangrovi]
MSKSIAASVNYVVNKPRARVLAAEGLRTDSVAHIIQDFSLLSKLNPALENKAGHISLSWSRQDREKLPPGVMVDRAREYMEKLGIRNTQYLIVEHRDTQNPHVHLLYNPVDYTGRRIPVDFQLPRSMRVIEGMIQRYGYHLHRGKEAVNRQRLNPAETARFELHDAVRGVALGAKSWEELQARLQRQGISLRFKRESQSGQVLGVSFKMGKYSFKGSTLDPGLGYGRLSRQLERNLEARLQALRAGTRQQPLARAASLLQLPPGRRPYGELRLDHQALPRAFRQGVWKPGPLMENKAQLKLKSVWKW